MDAGGLAQMSYNNFPTIGVPGSGFASRGKGAHLKHLSFEPTQNLDRQNNGAPTPRTSRSHLLAGLRTAPKSATTSSFPPSAPPTQLHHRTGLENSIYAQETLRAAYSGPKTSIGNSFPAHHAVSSRNMFARPDQILAPPEITIDEHGQEQMDPNLYAQLVATNMYLAEQQQRLQQQLLNVQAAAQQFQGLNLGHMNNQQFATPPVTPNVQTNMNMNMNMYQQAKQQSMQQVANPVIGGQPGLYSVYNPMTGQQTYYMDPNVQSATAQHTGFSISPPQQVGTPHFQVSPPPTTNGPVRSISPPKMSISPPQDHSPLPPPSANAFRRGHKKASSLANVLNAGPAENEASGSAAPKTAGLPSTPMTGTFGPGQARAGEHPIRQPRGPPSLDELRAKPTQKFEGSKNFATRQRRSAVHNLVRAGMERRRAPGTGSAGSITPISENGEMTFPISSSDNDSDSGHSGSGSLSGRPSIGHSRMSAHGAIGSDRPSSRQKESSWERQSVDSNLTTASISGDENSLGGTFAAVFKNAGKKAEPSEAPRRAPMLVLSSIEKRKSSVF